MNFAVDVRGGDLVLEFAVTCSHCGVNRSITEEVEDAPFGSYINMMDMAMELWNGRYNGH